MLSSVKEIASEHEADNEPDQGGNPFQFNSDNEDDDICNFFENLRKETEIEDGLK